MIHVSHFPDLPALKYRVLDSGWYRVKSDLVVPTGVKGFAARFAEDGYELLSLDMLGNLTIRAGFEWDGASGPALDTDSILYAALVHDAFYRLIEHGLSMRARAGADREFRRLIRHYAVTAFTKSQFQGRRARVRQWFVYRLRMLRATWCYFAVRLFGRFFVHQGKVSTVIKRIVMAALPLVFLPGCASAFKVINTADDAAEAACAMFFAEHQGITPEQAARLFCKTREALDMFLAAQAAAGEQMAASQGLSPK